MIKLDKISKKFGQIKALENISFTIKEGEIVGLLGPNGAGKTTTLRILTGFLWPTSGQVTINDLNLKDHEDDIKKLIGYLPENNPLYDELTVKEFLKFFADLKNIPKNKQKDVISDAVTLVGIEDVYYRPISDISKGYRQRTGLAQAILTKPQILLLDEPTEGLDPNQRQEIKKLILKLGKNRTVIISSHVLGEITQTCNRIVIIHKGKVVADGTTQSLAKRTKSKEVIIVEYAGKSILNNIKKIKGLFNIKEEEINNHFKLSCETDGKADYRNILANEAVKNNNQLFELKQKAASLEEIFAVLTKE